MSTRNNAAAVIFGEVLFDCFPDGNSVLGGAPFNVAWHLNAFGMSPLFISRVGKDALGEKVISTMQDWNMDTSGLQLDADHPTGSVDITFDDGEPQYSIVQHRAYDYIDAEHIDQAGLSSVSGSSVLYHGSLALRNQHSRDALSQLKQHHSGSIFLDVNLRDPWWQKDFVLALADDADWVKLNEDELLSLGAIPGSGTADIDTLARQFIDTHKLAGLVVTLGAEGAIALTDDGDLARVAPPQRLEVVDTVGAGDAFTSVLIAGLSNSWPLDMTMQRAQDFASHVVGQQGAIIHDLGFYRAILSDWNL